MSGKNFSDKKQLIWGIIGINGIDSNVQHNFCVCVKEDKIVDVGSKESLFTQYPEAEIIGSSNLILIPGMINSHDHGRGLNTVSMGVSDRELEIWLLELSNLPPIDPYLAAAIEGLRLLKSGVTAVAHSHNPTNWPNMQQEATATIAGYRDAGIRVAFHPPFIDQNLLVYDSEQEFLALLPEKLKLSAKALLEVPSLSRQDYFQLSNDLYKTYHDPISHKIHIQVSPAGGQWCSDRLILEAVEFAQKYQTKVQMHCLETRYQRQYAYRKWGKSFVRHLDEIGALGEWLTCAHMVWVDPEDLPLLARSGVGIAHNPSSNLRLSSGIAPIVRMRDAGLTLGIGLDGLTIDDDRDFFKEMRLAWTLSNCNSFDTHPLDAFSVWQMATSAGVKITFGKDVPLGFLAKGYLADLVLLNLEPDLLPTNITLDNLLRCQKSGFVNSVMVGGNWILKDGRSTTLETDKIEKEIRSIIKSYSRKRTQESKRGVSSLAPYLRNFYSQWDNQSF